MATKKNNRLVKLINFLAGNIETDEQADPLVNNVNSSLHGDVERSKQFTVVENEQDKQKKFSKTEIGRYVTQVMETLASTREDNEKIIQMVPDVSQAANIVVSSILSPNELKNSSLIFTLDEKTVKLDESRSKEILDLISNYFNKDLDLKYRLPDWITKALYYTGAKVLVTLPVGTLDEIYKSDKTSMENFDTLFDEELKSSPSFGMENLFEKTASSQDMENQLGLSLESFVENANNNEKEKFTKSIEKNGFKKSLVEHFLESLEIKDKPDQLKRKHLKTEKRKKMITKTVLASGNKSFLNVPKDSNVSTETHPLLIETPMESCIPLHVPGSPKDHIGYFVAIDDEGYPVEKEEMQLRTNINLMHGDSSRNSPFDNLFKSYGLQELKNTIGSISNRNNTAKMYGTIIESYIREKLKGQGFGDLADSAMNSLYHYMFSRYLKGYRVRFLYVPKDYVTYIAYDYNKDGTGKGRLENIKFFLSLRITLLIAQMMSAINNSTDHKNIDVQFDEQTNNAIKDPVTMIEQIANQYIKKHMVGFSLDPNHIMESMAKRSIHVKSSGLPGLPGLNISSESSGRQHQEPNTELSEDIRNQVIMGLGVPPSALNALSEHEYSRSVASSSLFFARDIEALQDKTLFFLIDFIKFYLKFDPILQTKMRQILHIDKKKNDEPDEGVLSEETLEQDAIMINKIIENLGVSLPKPNVSPSEAMFQNFRSFVDGVIQISETLWPDELSANDPEISEAIPYIRSVIRKKIIENYMIAMGYPDELHVPEISELLTDDPKNIEMLQVMRNFAGAIKAVQDSLGSEV